MFSTVICYHWLNYDENDSNIREMAGILDAIFELIKMLQGHQSPRWGVKIELGYPKPSRKTYTDISRFNHISARLLRLSWGIVVRIASFTNDNTEKTIDIKNFL